MRTIVVLMWKHMLVRKRKIFSTLLEFVVPVLLFMFLYLLEGPLLEEEGEPPAEGGKSTTTTTTTTTTPKPPGLRLSFSRLGTSISPVGSLIGDAVVLYYPATPVANAFMNIVAEKLSIRPLRQFPRLQYTVSSQPVTTIDASQSKRREIKAKNNLLFSNGYFPISNKTQWLKFRTIMRPWDAVIIFHNFYGATWPSTMNYTIRMTEGLHLKPFRLTEITRSHGKGSPGIQQLIFMSLQWAIDNAYISLRSGIGLNQILSIQEFPYLRQQSFGKFEIYIQTLYMFTYLSLLYTFALLVSRLTTEKSSGVPELIKMEGVSTNTLALSHILNVLPAGVVYAIVGCVTIKKGTVFPRTSAFFFITTLLLYYNTIIAFAFTISHVLKGPEYATTFAVVVYFLLCILSEAITSKSIPNAVKYLVGLLPHAPLSYAYSELSLNEIHGTGTGFDNMGTVKDGEFHLSILSSFIMHIVQIVLFLCLAKYLSLINPGKYGQAMPWHCNLKKAKKDEHVRDDASQQDERYFEEPPANLKVGIFVDNVSKKYPKHTALKNVTLKIFEGEITVLLGHNGAGKTTLMSIITGMTNPTKGKVYIYGIDSTKQKQARKHIGLCPQHNMYFPDLNLHEHLMFFTLLKGEKYKVARESSRQLAGKLGLEPKLKDMWVRLSGGMQRRAQLACALAGDAAVLILDEPTAGLDIETRRGLWDLLLSLRGARTVLLSTHHMEEADALGDRVAALRDGELGCYATNMFLKRAIGDGYRLTLNTVHEPKEHAITQKVHETVPEATVRERTISSITYNLPLNSSKTFPKLFGVIEENKAGLEIISIGVGVATLEEVFLKLGSNVDAIQGVDEEPEYGASGQGIESGAEYDQEKFYMDLEGKSHKKLKGARLYRNQFSVLLKRQLRFVLYRKWIFIFLQIFLPYFLIYNVTRGSNNEYQEADNRSLPLDLDMYTDIPSKRILCNFQLNESNTPFPFLRTLDSIYPDVEFQATNDVSNTIARIGKKSIKDYSTYLSGIEMNDTVAKVLYSRTVPHIAPVTLNIMSNLLGMRYLNQSKCHILTRNYPIQRSDKKPKSTAVIWTTWLTFVFEISLTYGLALPAREYVTGARNVHIMSGCSIQLYWFTTLLFHTVFAFVLLIIPIMLAAFLIDKDSTIDQVAIMVVLLVGTVALLAFMFWVTMVSKGRSPVLILVACIFILTLIFPLVKMVNDAIDVMVEGSEQKGQIYYAHKVLYFLATPYTVSVGMKDVAKTAMKNAQAGQYSISNYFSTHPESNCYTLIILLVQAIFFIELVLLIQKGTINTWCDRLKNKKYKPGDIDEINHEVNKEKAYVAHEITKKPADITTDSMLIHEVHKHYRSCYRKPINAVRGISISVKKGECFGLLGVNGAGKSSTFKMLTAEECATRGKIYGNGYFLNSSSSTKYLQTLSYTPQYNGLDLFLTGEQNLRLLLTLRGLEKETVKQEVKNWLKFVDLEVYAKKRLEAYSGGCMRRLVAAGSLCSGASVTLLDEPSAGVDVGARRQLWTALHVALRYQRSIIITSHSLDEMEVLCDRIAILCAGRVRALGSPNGLRTEYAAGHAVRFKIKHRITADNANEADDLNSQIMKTFDCELKDSHMTMLLYHINVTMHYSDLFQALEGLKNQFSDLIEDYTVTDTTLEEVFLALAEENKVPQPRV